MTIFLYAIAGIEVCLLVYHWLQRFWSKGSALKRPLGRGEHPCPPSEAPPVGGTISPEHRWVPPVQEHGVRT